MKFDYSNKQSRPVVKIRKEKKKKPKLQNRFIDKDTSDFRPPQPYPYPVHQRGPLIEEYFYDHYNNECSFHYLPIFWTNIGMTRNCFGRPQADLQKYLNSLDKKEKYFTIVQSDTGIAENVPKNVLVFGAGGSGHIPISLSCDMHPTRKVERDIFASFVGVINCKNHDRAGVRHRMRDALPQSSNFHYQESGDDTETFEKMMNRSTFALCPRGYGKTSFRLYEAIQMGCIPTYIYDDPWLPCQDQLNWNDFSVLCHVNDLGYLSDILHSYGKDKITRMQSELKRIYSQYFSYAGTAKQIIRIVKTIDKHKIDINNDIYDGLIRNVHRLGNEKKKITFAITTYNEFSDIHPGKSITECLQWPLEDDRIDEIVISDDCSDDFDKLQNLVEDLPKVKLYRNEKNLGTFGNKKTAIKLVSNDWVILFDSDNSCDKTYVDNIYDERWEDNTIYHPVFAAPEFDYSDQSSKTWTMENAPMYLGQYRQSSTILNAGNYFVNKKKYLEVLSPYPCDRFDLSLPNYLNVDRALREDMYWRLIFDPSDVLFVSKEWLLSGNKIKMVANQAYSHLVSQDSTCLKAPKEFMRIAPIFIEELLRRRRLTDRIDIIEYVFTKTNNFKHLDPWQFWKIIYIILQKPDITSIIQIGCFSPFIPKIICELLKEKPGIKYNIHNPIDIDPIVFGYTDACCPQIHNDLDKIDNGDILVIEDGPNLQKWNKTVRSFCDDYQNTIIYLCDHKKTELCDTMIRSDKKFINTFLIQNGSNTRTIIIASNTRLPCLGL